MKGKKPRKSRLDALAGRKSWPVAAAVTGLCLVHFLLAVTSVRHKSNTYDELAHLTRGYSYAMTEDYRLGPPHPPLAHIWASLPGRGLAVKFPPLDQDAWRTSDPWVIGREFFYYRNLGNAEIIDTLLFRGRAMIAVLSAALGIAVFVWSRRLFGTAGALISLTLYAFSPTMLAHAHLVTTDCAVALFFMCSLGTIWWMLHRLTLASVLCSAAALAGLFLSKMSAVMIIPVGVVLLVMRLIRREPLTARFGKRTWEVASRSKRFGLYMCVMVFWIAVVWTAIWAAYGFRYEAMRSTADGEQRFYSPNGVPEGKTVWEHQLRKLPTMQRVTPWLREHRVLPEAYIYSAVLSQQTARGRMSFLNGDVDIFGFRWFFPYAFAVKTPLPLFGILGAALAVPLYMRSGRGKSGKDDVGAPRTAPWGFIYRTAPLWVFFVLYWAASISSHLNIGHRHILPTYPVLFIFCGSIAAYLHARSQVVRALAPVLCGLFVLAGLSIYPNYLAYFNWFAGGPRHAWRHLVDSSLDWGQDLPGLAACLDSHPSGDVGDVYVAYFGSGKELAVRHFGIEARMLPMRLADDATGDYSYRPGRYAISATDLQQIYSGRRDWTDELEQRYQSFLPSLERLVQTPDDPEARKPFTERRFRKAFDTFAKDRFARLCAYLREREPDDQVSHTIMIYSLDSAALDEALHTASVGNVLMD